MAELPDPAQSRALLIGVSDFKCLDALPAVAGNLDGLAAALQDRLLWGLPPERCTIISSAGDEPITVPRVLRVLNETAQDVGSGGLLLVYYAGHGLVETDTGRLHLAVTASERGEEDATAIPYESVRRRVWRSGSTHRLVILDCCYAGRALVGEMSALDSVEDLEIEQSVILAAASRTVAALAPPGEPYTAFTGDLIRLLSDGIPDGPDFLDAQLIWKDLVRSQRAKSRPQPEFRTRNAGGDVPLVRNAWRQRGLPKAVHEQILAGVAEVAVVADVIDHYGPDELDEHVSLACVVYLAEAALRATEPHQGAAATLHRHWSPRVSRILAGQAPRLQHGLFALAAGAGADAPTGLLDDLLAADTDPDLLVSMIEDASGVDRQDLVRRAATTRPAVRVALVRSTVDGARILVERRGHSEDITDRLRCNLGWIAGLEPKRQAWLEPLLTVAGGGTLEPGDIPPLTEVCPDGPLLIYQVAHVTDRADETLPAVWPSLVASLGDPGRDRVLAELLLRPTPNGIENRARQDLLLLLMGVRWDRTPTLTKDYLAVLAELWRSPPVAPSRGRLAAPLVDILGKGGVGDGRSGSLLPAADPFGDEVRIAAAAVIGERWSRARGLLDPLAVPAHWVPLIAGHDGMGWLVPVIVLTRLARKGPGCRRSVSARRSAPPPARERTRGSWRSRCGRGSTSAGRR